MGQALILSKGTNPGQYNIKLLYADEIEYDATMSGAEREEEEKSYLRDDVWCADLTIGLERNMPKDGRKVGTIELNNNEEIIIMPGGKEGLGQLRKSKRLSDYTVLRNLILLPGWQKWQPTYRIGEVISVNLEDDTCDINIFAATSARMFLNINDVPIQEVMEQGEEVDPLAGWIGFASNYAGHPIVTNTGDTTVSTTSADWKKIIDVNNQVNNEYTYSADVEENWKIIPERLPEGTEDTNPPDSYSGDCEDFALTKADRLIEMGVSASALKVTVCAKVKDDGELVGHAVLTIDTNKGTYVLDNDSQGPKLSKNKGYKWISRLVGGTWYEIKTDEKLLESVPIDYMSCPASIFKEGDIVVVSFPDRSWETPKLIGFQSNPQSCDKMLFSFMDFQNFLRPIQWRQDNPDELTYCMVISRHDESWRIPSEIYANEPLESTSSFGGLNRTLYALSASRDGIWRSFDKFWLRDGGQGSQIINTELTLWENQKKVRTIVMPALAHWDYHYQIKFPVNRFICYEDYIFFYWGVVTGNYAGGVGHVGYTDVRSGKTTILSNQFKHHETYTGYDYYYRDITSQGNFIGVPNGICVYNNYLFVSELFSVLPPQIDSFRLTARISVWDISNLQAPPDQYTLPELDPHPDISHLHEQSQSNKLACINDEIFYLYMDYSSTSSGEDSNGYKRGYVKRGYIKVFQMPDKYRHNVNVEGRRKFKFLRQILRYNWPDSIVACGSNIATTFMRSAPLDNYEYTSRREEQIEFIDVEGNTVQSIASFPGRIPEDSPTAAYPHEDPSAYHSILLSMT